MSARGSSAAHPGRAAGLLVTLLILECNGFLLGNETECPTEALVDITEGFKKLPAASDGSITVDGVYYPADSIQWKNGRVLGCPCWTKGCLPLCCDKEGVCREKITSSEPDFFPIYDESTKNKTKPEDLHQFAWDPCHGSDRFVLTPEDPTSPEDQFRLLSSGEVYLSVLNETKGIGDYCLDRLDGEFRVFMCFSENVSESMPQDLAYPFPIAMLISVPFLIATLVVYILIPQLRNIHGLTVCAYVFCLVVAYTALGTQYFVMPYGEITDLACYFYAYIVHFSFLASFFWLNVMCFDIWWTFGGFRSLHGSVKQRERKKFIMYSIYAWGCATVLTVVCMIMDLVPGIPNNIVRPEFGKGSCWFESHQARFYYFYAPMGATVICNICLFVLTALKILRHKKDTARQLKGSESRRHDDNKQWFNLYLKLFIVMGINWSMEIISWLFEDKLPKYVWYITDLTNTLQGVIIFIIFVWKDKIKNLLLKRFGCEGSFLSRNSTRSGCPTSSTSRTTCITNAPLQEKINPYADTYRGKPPVTDESDCI